MNTRVIRHVVRCQLLTARLKYEKPRVNTVGAARLAESCTQAKGVVPVVELLAVEAGTHRRPMLNREEILKWIDRHVCSA